MDSRSCGVEVGQLVGLQEIFLVLKAEDTARAGERVGYVGSKLVTGRKWELLMWGKATAAPTP